MDLKERFAPFMACALHCASSSEGVALPLKDIQSQLIALAEKERILPMLPMSPGENAMPDIIEARHRELEDARFAVYAWADEKLLNAPRPDSESWMPLSLQCRYFSTTEAGMLFFSRLDSVLNTLGIPSDCDEGVRDLAQRLELARNLPEDCAGVDVLHVFALCLLYGFCGKLFDQKELLIRVRKACHALLQSPNNLQPKARVRTHANFSLLQYLEPVVYVLLPLSISLFFWLYCADILAHIPVQEF